MIFIRNLYNFFRIWHAVCKFSKSVSLVVNNMVIVSRSPRESAPVFLYAILVIFSL